jgi:hypothetical protein
VRHGLRRYPAVLVRGMCFSGTDFAAAEAEIAGRLVTGSQRPRLAGSGTSAPA